MEATKEKYTQFTPPYPNKYELNLELDEFPKFVDIENNNPTKSQLSLRAEEAKRLNIIYDNNNNFYEDKNIKNILSTENNNSNRMNDIYNIDLPNCFMRSSVVKEYNDIDNKKEKIEEKKIENNDNNMGNNIDNDNKLCDDDFEIDIDYGYLDNNNEFKNNEIKENIDNKELNDDFIDDNMFLIDENDFRDEIIRKKNKIFENFPEPNKENNNYEIEIKNEKNNNFWEEWEKRGIEKINKDINEQKARKHEKKGKIKKEKKDNYKEEIDISFNDEIADDKSSISKDKSIHHNITSLNIKGLKSNEYYIGEIIEKGPHFPSTLGIVKYINLELFSENYFGEKLQFQEIAMKDDFEKIIKLIPVGNKKYIFSKNNSPEDEIFREENDLIILHGKAGQETFYYIMKLTGQINGSSEYSIYKVKNIKRIVRHFKDSIGLYYNEEENYKSNNIITDGINYDMEEKPGIEYIIMTGQHFLSKYNKLIKKEKDVQDKKQKLEEKNNYNLNFEKTFEILNEQNNKNISEKNIEIEKKMNNIKRQREKINELIQEDKKYNENLQKIEEEKTKSKLIEEQLKIRMHHGRKKINDLIRFNRELQQDNIKKEKDNDNDNDYNNIKEEKNYGNIEELNEAKNKLNKLKEKLKNLESDIFCFNCNIKRREVIFGECSHLTLCKDCLSSFIEKGNKMKARCPVCKILCKRFFFINYD